MKGFDHKKRFDHLREAVLAAIAFDPNTSEAEVDVSAPQLVRLWRQRGLTSEELVEKLSAVRR
jgi:hypothetical protein